MATYYKYETIIIFDGRLTEETYNALINRYREKILLDTHVGGIIGDKLGKKKLAYPIKECSDGWFIMFTYNTVPDRIIKLERELRADEHVLKFMTVKSEDGEIEEDDIEAAAETPSEQDVSKEETVDIFDLIYGSIPDSCSLNPDGKRESL